MAVDPLLLQAACFRQALEFEQASICLTHSKYSDPPLQDDEVSFSASIPVNSAFSLELYLKCLILIRTGQPARQRHELKALFGELLPEHRDRIEELYKSENPQLSAVRPLGTLLEEANDAFQNWRYRHEEKKMLNDLRYAAGMIVPYVKAVILEAQPALKDMRRISTRPPT